MSTAVPSEVADEGRMTLIEHLTELRTRLVKSLVAITLCMVVGFLAYDWIFDFLLHPYRQIFGEDQNLISLSPTEGFSVRMRVSGYTGIGLAMPVLLWQIWRFVSPGLYEREKRYAIPFVASALVLFVLGAALAYFTIPRALEFLADIGGPDLEQQYRPSDYLRFITYTMLAFGIGFEFPILLVFLQLAGVVEPSTLGRYRRYVFVGIFVAVAVITPSGDPFSLLMLSLPMSLFYEAAILVGRLVRRRRARRDVEAEA